MAERKSVQLVKIHQFSAVRLIWFPPQRRCALGKTPHSPESPAEMRLSSTENAKSTPGFWRALQLDPSRFQSAGNVRSPGSSSGLLREIVIDACPALSATTLAALLLARLFEVLAATHFL